VGVLGFLIYQANQPVAALPATSPGLTQNLVLAPGTMPDITLSISLRPTLSLFAPLQGTLGTVTFATPNIVAAGTGSFVYNAIAAGTTACTATYTDSTGATQTSTFNVIVTMAKRRRARKTEENPGPELIWLLVGLGVVGAGATIYFVTRPPAPTAPAATPPGSISAAQIQAALNSFNAQVNSQIAQQPADTSTDTSAPGGPVNTGNATIDNAANGAINSATGQANDAVNSAASQLGF
jgi:hypothetical protein